MSARSSKLISWLAVSFLISVYILSDYARKRAGGYDAFMSSQTYRFEHYISHPNGIAVCLGCLFASWLFLGCYELIQYALGKLPQRTH